MALREWCNKSSMATTEFTDISWAGSFPPWNPPACWAAYLGGFINNKPYLHIVSDERNCNPGYETTGNSNVRVHFLGSKNAGGTADNPGFCNFDTVSYYGLGVRLPSGPAISQQNNLSQFFEIHGGYRAQGVAPVLLGVERQTSGPRFRLCVSGGAVETVIGGVTYYNFDAQCKVSDAATLSREITYTDDMHEWVNAPAFAYDVLYPWILGIRHDHGEGTGWLEAWLWVTGTGWVNVCPRLTNRKTCYPVASGEMAPFCGAYYAASTHYSTSDPMPSSGISQQVIDLGGGYRGDTLAEVQAAMETFFNLSGGSPTAVEAPGAPYRFGLTSAGLTGSWLGDITNYKRGSPATVPGDCDQVTDIYAYQQGTSLAIAPIPYKAVIYAMDGTGGTPGTRLGVSSQVSLGISQPAGWVQYHFASPVDLTAYHGQQVLLGTIMGGVTANSVQTWREVVTGAQFLRLDDYSTGPTDPWDASVGGGSTGQYDNKFAITAVYTPETTTDTTPPTFLSGYANSTTIGLTYSEALDTGSVPASSAYVVKRNGSQAPTPLTVSISGVNVTITLPQAVVSGETVTLTYIKPGINPIQDTAGNDAVAFTDNSLSNLTPSAARSHQPGGRVMGALRSSNPSGRIAGIGGGGI